MYEEAASKEIRAGMNLAAKVIELEFRDTSGVGAALAINGFTLRLQPIAC